MTRYCITGFKSVWLWQNRKERSGGIPDPLRHSSTTRPNASLGGDGGFLGQLMERHFEFEFELVKVLKNGQFNKVDLKQR